MTHDQLHKTPTRLLIVEDSERDAGLVRFELERAGLDLYVHRVDSESRFIEALEDEWDIIISDFSMPTFDGLRAFAIFKEWGIDVPFIFVSGLMGEDRAVEAMRAGAADYVLKGNLSRLAVAVRRELNAAESRRRQRDAEEEAERDRRRLELAVEASGAGIFEHRSLPRCHAHLSERVSEILGIGSRWPSGLTFADWIRERVHPADASQVEAYDAFMAGDALSYRGEFRIRSVRKEWRHVLAFAKASERAESGRATSVVGVVVDVSERARLEHQFRHSQKMEAIGRLAGGIAHDFNNLLTVILNYSSFLLNSLPEGDPLRGHVQSVLKAERRAEELTRQLLAFSRKQAVSPRIVDVNAMVEDVDRMLRRVIGEDVKLKLALSPAVWRIEIDPGAFEQVIMNLAINARDAMPNGGGLTIETDNIELDEEYGLAHGAAIPPGQYARISVSDTGIGMDEDVQRQVFEPFFTTKEAGRGTGLGLSTCYGIVKQAGGYIWVYSEPGYGSTFKTCFPRAIGEVEPAKAVSAPTAVGGTETIVVVEDDELVKASTILSLKALGYRVVGAADGPEALRLIAEGKVAPDLLVVDLVMPLMNGPELAERILMSLPGVKVLYMSGYAPAAILHRGVIEPGGNLIQKPFAPNDLGMKVREALERV